MGAWVLMASLILGWLFERRGSVRWDGSVAGQGDGKAGKGRKMVRGEGAEAL